MKTISISAHFDGIQILLDEPILLERNAKLLVTVLPEKDSEREAWLAMSSQNLEAAFGDYEPEYSAETILEANPIYETR